MIIKLNAIIPQNLAKQRLDQVLAQLFPDYSRAQLQQWIKAGQVTVDNHTLRPSSKVLAGQNIAIVAETLQQQDWQGQDLPLNIVYEDAAILVINKPPGLTVHPGAGQPDHTLVNALLHYDPRLSELPRAGIVHRLDKNTSGLLVIARDRVAHHALVKQLQQHQVKREYQALVDGVIISGGTISAAIDRHGLQRTKMAVRENGKPAVTHYRILERFAHHTLLLVQLETGRTHQIRVHMAYIHHPIVGDPTYGRLKLPAQCSENLKSVLGNFKRQALHAWRLELRHPYSGQVMNWQIEMPQDMHDLLQSLRLEKNGSLSVRK